MFLHFSSVSVLGNYISCNLMLAQVVTYSYFLLLVLDHPQAHTMIFCDFSCDGAFIVASGGDDGGVFLWQCETAIGHGSSLSNTFQQYNTPEGSGTLCTAGDQRASAAIGCDPPLRDRSWEEPGLARGGAGDGGSTASSPIGWPVPREVIKLKGHAQSVRLLVFAPGGRSLATASIDGVMRVGVGAAMLLVS